MKAPSRPQTRQEVLDHYRTASGRPYGPQIDSEDIYRFFVTQWADQAETITRLTGQLRPRSRVVTVEAERCRLAQGVIIRLTELAEEAGILGDYTAADVRRDAAFLAASLKGLE